MFVSNLIDIFYVCYNSFSTIYFFRHSVFRLEYTWTLLCLSVWSANAATWELPTEFSLNMILAGLQTIIACIDISSHTQNTPCDRFIVWLPDSTPYIGHHYANYTRRRIRIETKYREAEDL
jgi:hypothetical protein